MTELPWRILGQLLAAHDGQVPADLDLQYFRRSSTPGSDSTVSFMAKQSNETGRDKEQGELFSEMPRLFIRLAHSALRFFAFFP